MKDERLELLLDGYFDGRLSPLEARELDTLICTEPAARRRFWQLAQVHGELRLWGEREVGRSQAALALEKIDFSESPDFEERNSKPHETGFPWRPWALAAAAVLAVGGFFGWSRIGAGDPQTESGTLANARPLAWVIRGSGLVYGQGSRPGKGGGMLPGTYEISEGSGHIRFENGVDVTLTAPVIVELRDLLHVSLKSGALRVQVPEGAHGFTVEAPQAHFEDLGTEFGVLVEPNGRSALRVFDGEVRVMPPHSAPLGIIRVGESVAIEGNELRSVPPLSEALFPTTGEVAYQLWLNGAAKRQADPDLVFYYGFEPDENAPARLVDQATGGVHADGTIMGANWVSGRWPGKKGLQFENPGDSVRLSIPGEYTNATFASWVRIDRLDQSLSAILDTNGWTRGGLHWQVNRNGSPLSSGIFDGRATTSSQSKKVPLGRWIHLAMVLDSTRQEMRHYVDGTQVGARSLQSGDFRVCLQAACLGRLEGWNPGDHRELRGRMDEFSMWRRVLSQDELTELSEIGRPQIPNHAE